MVVFVVMQYQVDNRSADWSKELRNVPLLTAQPLQDWVILYPSRNSREAHEFLAAAQRVSEGLSIPWTRPQELVEVLSVFFLSVPFSVEILIILRSVEWPLIS